MPRTTYDRHCRWAFPMRHIEELNDQPEDSWPDYFVGTVVYFYPSCVLVEAADTKQLLRVYPGAHPGESIVDIAYSVTSAPNEEDRANHLLSFEFVKSLLCSEDFPMAEQCQRGLAAGRERVVAGRNEPLLQHLHAVWADGLGGLDASLNRDPASRISKPAHLATVESTASPMTPDQSSAQVQDTVGVSAVRGLFGTSQNEGASKDIPFTIRGYGPASSTSRPTNRSK